MKSLKICTLITIISMLRSTDIVADSSLTNEFSRIKTDVARDADGVLKDIETTWDNIENELDLTNNNSAKLSDLHTTLKAHQEAGEMANKKLTKIVPAAATPLIREYKNQATSAANKINKEQKLAQGRSKALHDQITHALTVAQKGHENTIHALNKLNNSLANAQPKESTKTKELKKAPKKEVKKDSPEKNKQKSTKKQHSKKSNKYEKSA